jgi:tetratricopeptide (TPR) repeat protein
MKNRRNNPRGLRLARLFAFGLGGCMLPACAGLPAPQSPGAFEEPQAAKVLKVETERLVVTREDALTVSQLLEKGRNELEAGRPVVAREIFEELLSVDPGGPFTEDTLYELGRSLEGNKEYLVAAQRFEEVEQRFPRGDLARESLLRAVRLRVHSDDFAQAGADAQRYSQHYVDLGAREEVVLAAACALAAVAARELETAEHFVTKGRSVVSRFELDVAGEIPRDVAQLYYALGEIRRIRVDPFPQNFGEAFETRARLLLDAESAYADAMRAYDAHWSTMAGYRIAELYQRLHTDVMNMPRPPGADTPRRKQLFEAALRMRYAVLLRKGINMVEHTLQMAARTGEGSEWVEHAQVRQRCKKVWQRKNGK